MRVITTLTRGTFGDHGTSLLALADAGRMAFPTALRGDYSQIRAARHAQREDRGPFFSILKRQLEFTISKVLFIGIVQGMGQTMLNLDLMNTARFLSGGIPRYAHVTIAVTLVNFSKSFFECRLVWKWVCSQDLENTFCDHKDWIRRLNKRRRFLGFLLYCDLFLLIFVISKFFNILMAEWQQSCLEGIIYNVPYPFADCFFVPESCRARPR